jgi:hypothetical protein
MLACLVAHLFILRILILTMSGYGNYWSIPDLDMINVIFRIDRYAKSA